jgi:AcrR family transcriptional regulator
VSHLAASLTTRNRDRAHKEIAEVAVRLFRQRGFDAVSVDEIATASGISRRTFFRYFGAKEDVLFHRHREYVEELRARLFAPEGTGDLAHLRLVLHEMFGRPRSEHDREVNRLMLTEPAVRARSDELASDFEHVVAERLRAAGYDEVRATLLAGAVMGALRAGRQLAVRLGPHRRQAFIDEAIRVLEEPWPAPPTVPAGPPAVPAAPTQLPRSKLPGRSARRAATRTAGSAGKP